MLRTEFIEDPAGFAGLREEWNALLRESASDTFFLTWEWLHSWWNHLARGRGLRLLTAREGGDLVAVAPLCTASGSLARLLPTLEFLGTGTAGSDYLDVIVRRGWEDEARSALAARLAESGGRLRLRQVPAAGSQAAGLLRALGAEGWRVSEDATDVCPFIRLEGQSWDSYLAGLGSEHRYNFGRRARNLQHRATSSLEQVGDEGRRRVVLATLFDLHDRRWRPRGGSDAFDAPGLPAFHEEVSRLALDRGWLRLFLLHLNGEPAAALYGFRYQRSFLFYQSGFDPRFAKWSLGLVTMGLVIRGALEEGAAEFDLLHGTETYKFHWAREVRGLARIEAYPPGLAGTAWAEVVRAERAGRRLARRLLPAQVIGWIRAGLAPS